MNFQVPQFIETEDKIIGPLTLKQFLYIALGAGIIFLFFFFLELWLWIILAVIIGSISAAFAFIKVNGRPLSVAFLSAVGFYWKPRVYLWKKEDLTTEEDNLNINEERFILKSKLNNLLNQLKTSKEPLPKREKSFKKPLIADREKSSKERFEMMRKITGEKELAKRVDYR
ncbi:PrgI family protein [Candidatus Wolfebacteria bacterium]|nr:PrgI family protein [Candidatus Wolfebacteria bacterium]